LIVRRCLQQWGEAPAGTPPCWWCIEDCPHVPEVLQTHPARNVAFLLRIGDMGCPIIVSIFLVIDRGFDIILLAKQAVHHAQCT
jgi:hypothetical protein